jgi:hypothetical protein
MTDKRKKEIKKAMADGKKAYLHRMIFNSPHFEKPKEIKKVFRGTITTTDDSQYELIDGDRIVIDHHWRPTFQKH